MKRSLDLTKSYKGIIYGLVIFACCLLQITLLPRYPIFGITPDITLSCVMAAAMFEGRKFGAIAGVCTGYFIDAIGSVGLSLSPLYYMLAGFITGIFAELLFRRGLLSWTMSSALWYFFRGFLTLILLSAAWQHYSFGTVLVTVFLPEIFLSFLFSYPVYFLFRLVAKPFHKAYELNS